MRDREENEIEWGRQAGKVRQTPVEGQVRGRWCPVPKEDRPCLQARHVKGAGTGRQGLWAGRQARACAGVQARARQKGRQAEEPRTCKATQGKGTRSKGSENLRTVGRDRQQGRQGKGW